MATPNILKSVFERVSFDATNPEHRKAAYLFFREHRWADLRFELEGDYTSIPNMMTGRMFEYFENLDAKL